MPRPSKEKKIYYNLPLSDEHYQLAIEVADHRGWRRSEILYRIVTFYLQDAVPSPDSAVLREPALLKDVLITDKVKRYENELKGLPIAERKLPEGLMRAPRSRNGTRMLQQALKPQERDHLADIKAYYGVSVHNLFDAALSHQAATIRGSLRSPNTLLARRI